MSLKPSFFELPERKRRAVLREFGNTSQAWIDRFPDLIASCVSRWNLELNEVVQHGLPINVIYLGKQAGKPVVLKVGHPHPEQRTEMVMLRHYAGVCTPTLIDCDEALGATLMTRVLPGATFRQSDHSPARSRVPLQIFHDLPLPPVRETGLPRFSEWLSTAFAEFREKFGHSHEFYPYVTLAESTYDAVLSDEAEAWLLHGDLHHENLLLDEARGWVAIDPKGVVGPKSLEVGRFLHNFLNDEIEGIDEVADASVDQLCEIMDTRFRTFMDTLGMPREQIARAAFVDVVLSFCWTINSDNAWRHEIKRLEATQRMLET